MSCIGNSYILPGQYCIFDVAIKYVLITKFKMIKEYIDNQRPNGLFLNLRDLDAYLTDKSCILNYIKSTIHILSCVWETE